LGDNNQRQSPTIVPNFFNIIKIFGGGEAAIIVQSLHTCFGKSSSNSDICSGNGICIAPNVCSCELGYSGQQCQIISCFGKNSSDPSVCSGNGGCSQYDTCTCNSGFDGDNCEYGYLENSNTIIWATGLNTKGQLGDNTKTKRTSFTKVFSDNFFGGKIAAGTEFSLLVKNYSVAYSWGINDANQLGNGVRGTDQTIPRKIDFENFDIVDFQGGLRHSIILKKDGRIYSIGGNAFGQLGKGTCCVDSAFWVPIPAENVTKIVASYEHSMFLKNDGTVFTFGRNQVYSFLLTL
jgi:hypothetical protein